MAHANNNVTPLYGGGEEYGNNEEKAIFNSAQVANINAAVRSIATMHLTVLIRTMFASMDSLLFDSSLVDEDGELVDSSHEELHALRMKYKNVEKSFIKHFGSMYTDSLMLSRLPAGSVSRVNDLQSFIMADEEDFEASIMLSEFVSSAQAKARQKLDVLQAGFSKIINDILSQDGEQGDRQINPVDPGIISEAFRASAGSINDDVVQMSILFYYFDGYVMQELDAMYDQIIDLFYKVGAVEH